MPSGHNASYSDLEAARQLSRQLRGARRELSAAVDGPQFASFAQRRVAPATGEADDGSGAMTLPPLPTPPEDGAWGESVWKPLLEYVVQRARGRCAMAFDAQGLVIAFDGDIDAERAQAWGGRLLMMLDQASHLTHDVLASVCLEIDGAWLTGVRALDTDHSEFTLAVCSDAPCSAVVRDAFGGVFRAKRPE